MPFFKRCAMHVIFSRSCSLPCPNTACDQSDAYKEIVPKRKRICCYRNVSFYNTHYIVDRPGGTLLPFKDLPCETRQVMSCRWEVWHYHTAGPLMHYSLRHPPQDTFFFNDVKISPRPRFYNNNNNTKLYSKLVNEQCTRTAPWKLARVCVTGAGSRKAIEKMKG